MEPGWKIPKAAVDRGLQNVSREKRPSRARKLPSLARRADARPTTLLIEEADHVDEAAH
jgi:hypothetical protein